MSKVKNIRMKNRKLTTSFGTFKFDENGVANVPEECVNKLLSINGYKLVGEPAGNDENKDKNDAEVKTSDEVKTSQADDENDSSDDDKEDEAENEDGESDGREPQQLYTEEELEDKNVAQLKKIARENGIDLNGASRKDDIIAQIMEEVGKE